MAETEALIENQPKAGAILRKLRDKKNLSIQEVASQMHLDPRIIEALEKDDYESFPADTYIRGYLRNYAKLLDIEGDDIISVYESEAPEPPEIIPDVKHSTQVSSSDKPVKAFTYLVTFILVLLLFIWWYQGNFTFSKGIKLIPVPDNTTTSTQPAIKQNTTSAESQPNIPEATPGDSTVDVQPTQTKPETSAVETDVVATTTTATDEDAQTIEAADVEESGDNNSKAMPGPDTLYFKLNDDCWIEVHDRFNKEVYVNLARTGDEIYLNGFAPFQVKLGKAQAAVLEFNNKPFDTAPYTTRGIARFTLGD